MAQVERWQLGEQGPEAYEQHLVPVRFAPWAVFLVAQAALQPGERVLDAACGTRHRGALGSTTGGGDGSHHRL